MRLERSECHPLPRNLSWTHFLVRHAELSTVVSAIESFLGNYCGIIDYYYDYESIAFLCKQVSPRGTIREDNVNIFWHHLEDCLVVEVHRIFGDGLLFDQDNDIVNIWSRIKFLQIFSDRSTTNSRTQQISSFYSNFFTSEAFYINENDSNSSSENRSIDNTEELALHQVFYSRPSLYEEEDIQQHTSDDLSLRSPEIENSRNCRYLESIKGMLNGPNRESKLQGIQSLCQFIHNQKIRYGSFPPTEDIHESYTRRDSKVGEEQEVLKNNVLHSSCVLSIVDILKSVFSDFTIIAYSSENLSTSRFLHNDSEESKQLDFSIGWPSMIVQTDISLTIVHEIAIIALDQLLTLLCAYCDEDDSFTELFGLSSFWSTPLLEQLSVFQSNIVAGGQGKIYAYAAVFRSVDRMKRMLSRYALETL